MYGQMHTKAISLAVPICPSLEKLLGDLGSDLSLKDRLIQNIPRLTQMLSIPNDTGFPSPFSSSSRLNREKSQGLLKVSKTQ